MALNVRGCCLEPKPKICESEFNVQCSMSLRLHSCFFMGQINCINRYIINISYKKKSDLQRISVKVMEDR